MSRVLLIYSGGMDSSTLLWDILSSGDDVEAVTFDYGQRHSKEIDCAQKMISYINSEGIEVRYDIIDVKPIFKYIDSSALTNPAIEVPNCGYTEESAKITVVPNRNQILLSIATGIAAARGINKVLYAAHNGDHCLPGSTNIFTRRGIIKIEDIIPYKDEVLSKSSDGNLQWKIVTDKVKKGIPKGIINIKTTSGASIRCTEEHKIYNIIRSNWTKKKGWTKSIITSKASDINTNSMLCIPSDPIDNIIDIPEIIDLYPLIKNTDNITMGNDGTLIRAGNGNWCNRYIPFIDYIKLLCWYVTEGYPSNGNIANPNRFGIYISQSASENIENLSDIQKYATNWGFCPTIHGEKSNSAVYFSGATASILRQCGENSYEKHLPENWMEYPNNILEIILDALIRGDGHKISSDHFSYTTVSKKLYKQVEYIATRLGYRVSHRNPISNPKCIVITMIKKSNRKPTFNRVGSLSINKVSDVINIMNDENVYDITVQDNHNFFAGDNGWVLVSNSVYPDCRPVYLDALNEATRISTLWHPVRIEAPFIHLTKAEIVKIGLNLGVPYEITRSCYNAGELSCGTCPTCVERIEAFTLNNTVDPLEYLPH